MCLLSLQWIAVLCSLASALHVHRQDQPGLPFLQEAVKPMVVNPGGYVEDPGTLIYTSGAEDDLKLVELPKVYGDRPIIRGLNHCDAFRATNLPSERKWGIAGMPNTGTNALFHLMHNCQFGHEKEGWQMPEGKHRFLSKKEKKYPDTLAVAIVKDPIQWMASTCRHSYFPVQGAATDANNPHCPSPVKNTSGSYQDGTQFESLVDVWGRWYSEYFENDNSISVFQLQEQPALIIRFEDLLFKPEATIREVCGCLGFEANAGKDFQIIETMAKWGKGHKIPTNRSQTIEQYTTKRDALQARFTKEDITYMEQSLVNTDAARVMQYFHYNFSAPSNSATKLSTEEHATKLLGWDHTTDIQELLAASDWGDDD